MNPRKHWLALCMLLALGLVLGCSGGKEHKDDDDHDEKGPHGGMLFATKDHKFHLELTKEKEHAVLYVLDGDAKKAVTTKAASFTLSVKGHPEIDFKADRQKDDPADAASRLQAAGPLPEKLDVSKAEITGSINDKTYHFTPE